MENIDFKGKAITLKSENGPENCILNGGDSGSDPVVFFSGTGDSTTVLFGFTISSGNSNREGAGMLIQSSPRIENCIFTKNKTEGGKSLIFDHWGPISLLGFLMGYLVFRLGPPGWFFKL